jgi:uncharacterized protein YqgQ
MSGKYFHIPKVDGFTRSEVVAMFKVQIMNNKSWARAALIKIGDEQTNKEKNNNRSILKNDYGFSKSDAPILTRYYKKASHKEDFDKGTWKKLGLILQKYAAQAASLVPRDRIEFLAKRYYEEFITK